MSKQPTIFKTEEKAIDHAKAVLNDEQFQNNPLLAEFSILAKNYRRIYKQFRRLIKLSDNQQLRLNELNHELAELNASKDKFFSIISHDLRNSFGYVMGFSEMLKHQVEENASQADIIHSAQIVYDSATNLYTLLENLLTWSRLQRGVAKAQPEDIKLDELAQHCVDLFTAQSKNKRIHLKSSVTADMRAYADYNMVNTVLRNLLSNAIKFTSSGGTVEISARPYDETFIEVAVSDMGVGIHSEDIPKLFRIDIQHTSTGTAGEKGTGLGLNLCQEFVEKNDGKIWVESEIGQGATFRFTLPQAHLLPQQKPLEPEQPSAPKKSFQVTNLNPNQYRMLVVDDVLVNRQLLINFLSPFGFRFREANNGQEALKIWETWQPHLIWMDIRMPIMNGYDTIKQIKASPKGAETIIIVLTSSIVEAEYLTAFAAGCDNLLRKPFNESEILDVIHQYLGIQIEYEKEQKQEIKQPVNVTSAHLATLSEDLRISLWQAASVLDYEQCLNLIEHISLFNTPLANGLTEMVQNFRFDMLEELCE